MPTPIVYQERLFVVDNSGILSCYSMENGTRLFRKRIRNEDANAFTASPVIAGNHLFAVSEIGITFVVSLKEDGKVVAENKLGEPVLASPAIAGNKLLIRGENTFLRLSQTPSQTLLSPCFADFRFLISQSAFATVRTTKSEVTVQRLMLHYSW